MMNRLRATIWSLAAMILAAGCSPALVGAWKAVEDTPDSPHFFVKQVQFRKDGTYSASARQTDRDLFLNGRYEFDGMNLTLKADGRADRKYHALIWWGSELEITKDNQKQRLRKQ
jgi:hypothetical protein